MGREAEFKNSEYVEAEKRNARQIHDKLHLP